MPAEAPVDNMAPRYIVEAADKALSTDVARFIRSVEYESADGLADVAKIELANPDFIFSESTIFQPGNELNIYMGYGPVLEFLGRVQIAKLRCDFPQASMPRAQVVGYTKEHRMMDNAPEKGNERVFWPTPTMKEVMESVATRYGFQTFVDDYQFQDAITQKAGMSDYDLCKGLANVAGFLFWVEGSYDGIWTLYCVGPNRVATSFLQFKKYSFNYAAGEKSTLLEFSPEYALRGARTEIKLAVRDPDSGEDYVEIFEDDATAPNIQSKGGSPFDSKLEQPIPTGASIRLFFGEYSLEVVPNKSFVNAEDARRWAEGWFLRQRRNFLLGNGKTIGIELLKARQVHTLNGLGVAFDGDYYFSRVNHVAGEDGQYICDFTARKYLPE